MRYGVLGTLEVVDDNGALPLGKPQQRAVLAMLVLDANRVVSLERIIDNLWDGGEPAHAAGTVHACVSMLRRVLEPQRSARAPASVLVSQAPGYLLRAEPDAIDALRFERLATVAGGLIGSDPERAVTDFDAALALWRGPALADFASASWATVAAARLEELRSTAVENRFDALLAAGHRAALVADLEAAVTISPLRERLWGQLIVALYRSGRQADALRAYQRARHVLAEELGIEPGPELQALERRVLSQSPDLDAQPDRGTAHVTATTPVEPGPASATTRPAEPIFGRDSELAVIGDAIEHLRNGSGGAIAVTGAAGAGKTRLVESALDNVGADIRVSWARCVEGDIAPPLWPWLQLASALGVAGGPLAAAIRAQPGTDAPSETAQRQMYDNAVNAVARLGAPPVVLVIDDAQWADNASQHIIQLLVSRLPELRALVLLTVRDGDHSGAETSTTLAAIARSPAGRRVELHALDQAAVAQVLASRLGRPAAESTTALMYERSGGNAFFLAELARLLDPECDEVATISRAVPASVRDVVSHRVAALPDDTRAALAAAAVLGREFDVRIVQRLTGLDPMACLEAIDLATVAGIVEAGASATRHQFRHDLAREAVYDDLSLATRTERHAAATGALRDMYGDDPGRAVEIAAHAWAGRPLLEPETVVEHLKHGARVALAGYASERTEQLLDRAAQVAADLPDRSQRETTELDLALRLAHLASDTHGYSDARTARRFERAIELHSRIDDASEVSPDMLMELSSYLSLQGRIQHAGELADQIVVSARRRRIPLAECAGNIAVSLTAWYLGDMERSAHAVNDAIELARGIPRAEITAMFGFPQLGNWLSFLALVRCIQGDDDGVRAAIVESRSELDRLPDAMSAMWADAFSSWRAVIDDDPAAGRRRCERFVALADATGTSVVLPQAEIVDGWAEARLGDAERGLHRIRAGRVGIVAAETTALVLGGVALEAEVLAQLGRTDEALELVEGTLRAQAAHDEALLLPEVHRRRGELLVATDPGEARRAFSTAAAIATAQGAGGLLRLAESSLLRLDGADA